jgi:hypothetical protein
MRIPEENQWKEIKLARQGEILDIRPQKWLKRI